MGLLYPWGYRGISDGGGFEVVGLLRLGIEDRRCQDQGNRRFALVECRENIDGLPVGWSFYKLYTINYSLKSVTLNSPAGSRDVSKDNSDSDQA